MFDVVNWVHRLSLYLADICGANVPLFSAALARSARSHSLSHAPLSYFSIISIIWIIKHDATEQSGSRPPSGGQSENGSQRYHHWVYGSRFRFVSAASFAPHRDTFLLFVLRSFSSSAYFTPVTSANIVIIALETGELVKDEYFTLFEAVGALEVCPLLSKQRSIRTSLRGQPANVYGLLCIDHGFQNGQRLPPSVGNRRKDYRRSAGRGLWRPQGSITGGSLGHNGSATLSRGGWDIKCVVNELPTPFAGKIDGKKYGIELLRNELERWWSWRVYLWMCSLLGVI